MLTRAVTPRRAVGVPIASMRTVVARAAHPRSRPDSDQSGPLAAVIGSTVSTQSWDRVAADPTVPPLPRSPGLSDPVRAVERGESARQRQGHATRSAETRAADVVGGRVNRKGVGGRADPDEAAGRGDPGVLANLPTQTRRTDLPAQTWPTDLPTRMRPTEVPTRTRPTEVPTRTRPAEVPTRARPAEVPTRARPAEVPTRACWRARSRDQLGRSLAGLFVRPGQCVHKALSRQVALSTRSSPGIKGRVLSLASHPAKPHIHSSICRYGDMSFY